jgi:PAS domain S-box-containing protein
VKLGETTPEWDDAIEESSVRAAYRLGPSLRRTEGVRRGDVFEMAPIALLIADRAGVIRDANSAAGKLLGAEPRRLRGWPLAGLAESEHASVLRELVDRATSGSSVEGELRLRRLRGAAFDGAVTCGPLEGGSELLFSARPTAAPRTLHEDAAALARALRDKEELLAREHAIRAQLEKTDRAKDRFIAILSHDLRGPINAVLGWTSLLRKEMLPKDARDRALETIERSSRNQLALVEELLDLSRITADRMTLELVPIDLGICVRRIAESQKPVAADASIELEIELGQEPSIVFADRRRIEQIVSNLLSNALKFTPPGGKVGVRVRRDGAYATIDIVDTGQGIDPGLLGQLFECYRQDAAPATARAGLGLGLYIVRQLVQLHGGSVEAESGGRGTGSRFIVRLPLREIPADIASDRILPDLRAPDLEGVRVLIVEDDADSRELLTAVMIGKGASVSAAADAAEAVAMYASWRPDVVVSDIELPDEDGYSLIRRLRAYDPDVHAVAVSGFAAPKDADRALDAGFDVHLGKPVEACELITTIRNLAARKKRGSDRG